MSGEAVGWAFRKVQMDDPTAKFVLVAICNYADAEDKAWPSHDDLVRVTGLSKRAVQNNLKKLVDWGIIQRVREFRHNGSENNPSVYLDLESRPVVKDGVASGATPTSQEVPPGVAGGATLQTTDTKPQKNLRASKADQSYSEDFENLWQQYPRTRNTSKKDAWNFYRMMTDEKQEIARRAVPLFAAAMRAEGRPEDKIMHMIRFLRGGVYETVSAPPAAASSGGVGKDWHLTATRAQWATVLDRWAASNDWRSVWGPAPGKPGCAVPVDLVAAHNLKHRAAMFSAEELVGFERIVEEAKSLV